jgi:hypothetical protein
LNHLTRTHHSLYSIKNPLQQVETYLKSKQPKKNKVEMAFAISLKSKTVSRNWNKVQSNLAKTLHTILNNSDSNFRIVIAGHEKPRISEIQHRRVKWLPMSFPPPSSIKGFSKDKIRKRKAIGVYLRKIGFYGYFMPLDADDWIHYRLVEYVRSQPKKAAIIMKRGMMVNLLKKEVWLRKDRFYKGCGSGTIFYFANKDFPLSSNGRALQKKPFRIVLRAHPKVVRNLAKFHKPYKFEKMPLVTWVLAHGDNNSMLKGKKNNSVSANDYGSKGLKLENGYYCYFKIRKK